MVGGLARGEIWWAAFADKTSKRVVNLVGNIVIAFGFISYIGLFIALYRDKVYASWIGLCTELSIPVDDAFSLVIIFEDPVKGLS